MTETLQATIQAHPNWFVARFVEAQKPDKKDLLDLEPIIAWEVWRARPSLNVDKLWKND